MNPQASCACPHDSIALAIDPGVLALGVTGIGFAMRNLNNRATLPAEFDALRDHSVQRVAQSWQGSRLESDPILADFRRLHAAVGATGGNVVASPESLIKMVQRTERLPRINLLVDIYNLVSVETRLSLGAHDIERVSGNITLRLADGSERFRPLGSAGDEPVSKGEYCYIDDANDVLCRLEVRQCDKSKVTPESRQCFFMIQGNRATTSEYLKRASERLVALIRQFCGGEIRMLWTP